MSFGKSLGDAAMVLSFFMSAVLYLSGVGIAVWLYVQNPGHLVVAMESALLCLISLFALATSYRRFTGRPGVPVPARYRPVVVLIAGGALFIRGGSLLFALRTWDEGVMGAFYLTLGTVALVLGFRRLIGNGPSQEGGDA